MTKLYNFLFLAKFCKAASLVLSHTLPISTPKEAGMQVTGTSHMQDVGEVSQSHSLFLGDDHQSKWKRNPRTWHCKEWR